MGTCCVNASKCEFPPRPDPSHLEVRLSGRRQSHVLTSEEAEDIIQGEIESALKRYRRIVAGLIERGPHDHQRLQKSLETTTQHCIAFFKSQFLERRPGEFVCLEDIRKAEEHLKSICGDFCAAALFANQRMSYDQCTAVAEKLMTQFKRGEKSKKRVMATFLADAIGPMRELCGGHLRDLLVVYQQNGESAMLERRQRQLHLEQKALRRAQLQAEERASKADIDLLCGEALSRQGSQLDSPSPSLGGGLSVLGVIMRIPSVDMSESERRSESISLASRFEGLSQESSPGRATGDTDTTERAVFVMQNSTTLEEDSSTTKNASCP